MPIAYMLLQGGACGSSQALQRGGVALRLRQAAARLDARQRLRASPPLTCVQHLRSLTEACTTSNETGRLPKERPSCHRAEEH